MRTTARSATAALAALPLVLGAVAPATAATSGHIRSSGSFASVDLTGPNTSEMILGNYLWGSLEVYDDMAMGWVDTFNCEEGETPEAGECDWLGFVDLYSPEGVDVTTGKGRNAAVDVEGELWATHVFFDEETGEDVVTELGTMTLDASFISYGKPVRITETVTYRDGNTGETFSYRVTQSVSMASVTGSLGDLDLDGRDGYVGSFRSQDRWRTP